MRSTITIILLGALATCLPAQESEATLLGALDRAAPRHTTSPGTQPQSGGGVDWDKAIDAMGAVLSRAAETKVEPLALYYMGNTLFSAGRIDEARATFEDLGQRFPTHPLVTAKLENDESLLDGALAACASELAFRRQHTVKSLPKPVLDKSLRVILHFNLGDVELAFYENVAPAHRKHFLDLARKGYYDGTHVHRVVPGVTAHLGDPNTRDKSVDQWGRGGPDETLPAEFSRLTHDAGTVTMARGRRLNESHGSQFQILLRDQPHLDFVQTPFARVVRGLDIIDNLSRQVRNQYEGPSTPCYITGITIEPVEKP